MCADAVLKSLRGLVSHGDKRGRVLGFPTANLPTQAHEGLAYGVYASRTRIKGVSQPGAEGYLSVSFYGARPTFDGVEARLETHIFDFKEDIYGCEIEVQLTQFLRPERRFGSVDELIASMTRDIEKVRVFAALRTGE